MILHTFNKSPALGAAMLGRCLSMLAAGDSLLLLEDAAYAALPGQLSAAALAAIPQGVSLYVLSEDLAARGISARILPVFSKVTYVEFVSLSLVHDKVVNWN